MFDLKDKVLRGIERGIVRLISNPNDGCLACQIGDYWFYFIGMEDENLTPEEAMGQYTVAELAELITSSIVGLDDDERLYYSAVLKEFFENKCS